MIMSNHDLIERNELNQNSKGGTELLQERLYDGTVPRELLEQFQIVFSRVRGLDENKFRIFYAHDLPGDPESEFLHNEGWRKFHRLVFVSNWQMQRYIDRYNIPWSMCQVINNSIIPLNALRSFPSQEKDEVRIIYTPTPHRGLQLLYPAFAKLATKYDNVKLHVYSSFKLYGWEQRDNEYAELYRALDDHPAVVNHGTVTNEVLREAISDAHIFAYPSIWPETSCLCLIEAMSAGLVCIHSNYGALPETSAGYTHMYQYDEDPNRHATRLYHILDGAIDYVRSDECKLRSQMQKIYTDSRFHWHNAAQLWTGLLSGIVSANLDKRLPEAFFHYKA